MTVRRTVAQARLQFFATGPAETGAVTVALRPDVQAEAHDRPEDLFTERPWFVPSQPGPVVQATRSFTCEKGQTYE
jgi:TPP-dependent trihydroxycyclohexane-1,2-dione (THcHDO) dehydratase